MAAINEITGDSIQTRMKGKTFDDNYDKIDRTIKLEEKKEEQEDDLVTMKAEFLERWNLSGEEGEKVWQEKLNMMYRQGTVELPYVREDYKPYQSMIDGRMIEGKKAHREHLKRNNCIEAGDMPIKNPERPRDNLKEQIAREVYNKLRY